MYKEIESTAKREGLKYSEEEKRARSIPMLKACPEDAQTTRLYIKTGGRKFSVAYLNWNNYPDDIDRDSFIFDLITQIYGFFGPVMDCGAQLSAEHSTKALEI